MAHAKSRSAKKTRTAQPDRPGGEVYLEAVDRYLQPEYAFNTSIDVSRIRAQTELTGVKLPFVHETELERLGSNSGEPQPISVRLPSARSLYIDTRLYTEAGLDKTNFVISRKEADYSGTMIEKASKLTVTRFQPYMISPNVNPRNQVLRLVTNSVISGTVVTDVTIPTGWYTTVGSLAAAMLTAFNATTASTGVSYTMLVGGPGFLPSGVPFPVQGTFIQFLAAGGTFTFDPDSVGFRNGKSLWNSPAGGPLATKYIFGPVGLIYTRTLDICSSELTRHASRVNYTNNQLVPTSLLCRVTLGGGNLLDPVTELAIPNPYNIPVGEVPTTTFDDALQLDAFMYNPSQIITAFDLSILDQYGLPLWVPAPFDHGPPQNGFDYLLNIFVQ